MTVEDIEDLTLELIELVWPLLDVGATRSDITTTLTNVLNAWEPLPNDS